MCFLFLPPTIGLIFSIIECIWVSNINIKGPEDKVEKLEDGDNPVEKMKEIASYIAVGANAFLKKRISIFSCFYYSIFNIIRIFC